MRWAFVVMMLASWGCTDCPTAPLHTTVRVHVPHASLVPTHCMSSHAASCRTADEVSALTYVFEFDQYAQGRLWCSYPDPVGIIRTDSCAVIALDLPAPDESETARTIDLLVQECDVQALPSPEVGDACSVRTRPHALPLDSCGEELFCRSSERTCQRLPESCSLDTDCNGVEICDETHLCVRFACDAQTSECVYPDECLDTSDCQRSHSRCDPRSGRCHTFTCETGRCVGVSPGSRGLR